jgi:hypothetical protein
MKKLKMEQITNTKQQSFIKGKEKYKKRMRECGDEELMKSV